MPVLPPALLVALYGTTIVVAVTVAVGVLRRGRGRTVAARSISVALVAASVWSLGALVAALTDGPVMEVALSAVVMPSVAVVVAAFWTGLAAVAGDDRPPGSRARRLLVVHPLVMLALGVTNPWHHLVILPSDDGYADGEIYGPLFWVHALYSYGVMTLAAVRAHRVRRDLPLMQGARVTVMLAVSTLPAVGALVQITLMPAGSPDLAPLLFTVVGLVDAHLVVRRNALRVVPIARAQVLDALGDAVLVMDRHGAVADANRAALTLLDAGSRPRDVLGRPADVALAVLRGGPGPLLAPGLRVVRLGRGEVVLDVRTRHVVGRLGRVLGEVVVLRDVSDDVRRERALAQANQDLRDHVATIERLQAELAEQAVRDSVTGLHNRRHLDLVLTSRAAAAAEGGPQVAVAIVDADHFKTVNDVHGHAVGDRVLETLARSLAGAVAPGDALVRYGGEEFVVVMSGVSPQEAVARAEELRLRCGSALTPARDLEIGVTVSVGVAASPDTVPDPQALLEAADRALYEAKDGGRDQVRYARGAIVAGESAGHGVASGPGAAAPASGRAGP
ncbi:diguanylate cyclase [Cellulomonas bogoriensis]|uniref:GGDEF domain-containing protein n=1 Tax=Cellulomonas bogoriensis 69B4 = DSM 16987 TaxID=1386082 RepID=A0A0A0C1C6_9CELL|nr:diguanylate cyclase [Cellulomonas bogoriensis]KGM14021.1 hypothetical protein N869_06590 [Cellulomonas bogoriensis 69B4 = DSM 16987]